MSEKVIWGIHAGKTGDTNSLFLKKKYIAVGWHKMGNLSEIAPDRESFKEKVSESFPDIKPGAIPNVAGQTFRFLHVMKQGDLVVFPSRENREVNIGEVVGDYEYNPSINQDYPNMRKVVWRKSHPRTFFTQGALYEIGSAMTLFQVTNYADEFLNALEDSDSITSSGRDDTIGLVVEEIENTTKDYILKRLAQELKGHPFAEFVAHLLQQMSYRTRVSPDGPDGGVDIIAHRDELGFEPPIIKVQVKSSEGNIGDPIVSSLYGKVENNEFGLLVSLGSYTKQAKNFAAGKSNLRLIDGEDLVQLVLSYYDGLDSKYKGLIPLKRVYIPEQIEEAEE